MAQKPFYIPELPVAKLFLILVVVLVHASFLPDMPADAGPQAGRTILVFLADIYSRFVVMVFYFFSAFLMFRNVSPDVRVAAKGWWPLYLSKLRSKVRTLLVPYLIWNLLSSLLFIYKASELGYDGFGVFPDGEFSFKGYLEGFWALTNNAPYNFALWFLRNLIVFVAISPILYLFAAETPLLIALTLASILTQLPLVGVLYFTFGAYVAMRNPSMSIFNNRMAYVAGIAGQLLLSFVVAMIPETPVLTPALILLRDVAAIPATLGIAHLALKCNRKFFSMLAASTFFVYCFHAVITRVLRIKVMHLTGYSTLFEELGGCLLSFILLTAISVSLYYLLRRIMPRLTALLCGGR